MNKTFPVSCLIVLAGAAVLTACIRIPDRPKSPVGTTEVVYRFEGGEDLTALFSLEAAYTTADGRTASEPIASLPWSKRIGVVPPFGARLAVAFRKRATYLAKESYAVGYAGGIETAAAGTATPPLRNV